MEACAILNEDSLDSVAHLLQVGISGCSMWSQDGEGSYSVHNIQYIPGYSTLSFFLPLIGKNVSATWLQGNHALGQCTMQGELSDTL